MKPKVLVIDASGSLGKKIYQALRELFDDRLILLVGDYQKERDKYTAKKFKCALLSSTANNEELSQAIESNLNCVIVTIKQKEPVIQEICA